MASPVSFNKEISLGNLMSAAVMLVTATIFILTIKNTSQLEMAELRAEMKVYSTKLEQLNRDFTQYKSETANYNTEVRQTLSQVSAQIADMRVLIAGSKDPIRR